MFQKTAEDNNKIKAPKKDYTEATVDVKYQEEIEIEKPVFQSKKGTDEPHFVDINTNEDVRKIIYSYT